MKKTKNLNRMLLFITFFSLTVFLEAQTLWQNTRYGMTINEVRELYPHALDIIDYETVDYFGDLLSVIDLLVIEQYEIVGHLFDITFGFTVEENTLYYVTLACNEPIVCNNGHNIYYRLYDEFTQQYGKAVKDERTRPENQGEYWTTGTWRTTWNSKNTDISISYSYSQNYSTIFPLRISYFPVLSE